MKKFKLLALLTAVLAMSVTAFAFTFNVYAENTELTFSDKASIRYTQGTTGLRFTSFISNELYSSMINDDGLSYKTDGDTFGMLIVPENSLTDYTSGDYIEFFTAKFGADKFINLNFSAEKVVQVDETQYKMDGVITNIKATNVSRNFVAISYAKQAEAITYSQVSSAKCVATVASSLASNIDGIYSDNQKTVIWSFLGGCSHTDIDADGVCDICGVLSSTEAITLGEATVTMKSIIENKGVIDIANDKKMIASYNFATKQIDLTLNNASISSSESAFNSALPVNVVLSGTNTITGGTTALTLTNKAVFSGNGNLTIDGCVISNSDLTCSDSVIINVLGKAGADSVSTNMTDEVGGALTVSDSAKLNITRDSAITGKSGICCVGLNVLGGEVIVDGVYEFGIYLKGNVVVSSGTITMDKSSYAMGSYSKIAYSFTGGEITATNCSKFINSVSSVGSTIVVDGATLTGTTTGVAIPNIDITLNSGEITLNVNGNANAINQESEGHYVVNGGTLNIIKIGGTLQTCSGINSNKGEITVTGGTINFTNWEYGIYSWSYATMNFSGGNLNFYACKGQYSRSTATIGEAVLTNYANGVNYEIEYNSVNLEEKDGKAYYVVNGTCGKGFYLGENPPALTLKFDFMHNNNIDGAGWGLILNSSYTAEVDANGNFKMYVDVTDLEIGALIPHIGKVSKADLNVGTSTDTITVGGKVYSIRWDDATFSTTSLIIANA